MRELDHRLHGLTVARQTIRQWISPHQAAQLCQGLVFVGEGGISAQLS